MNWDKFNRFNERLKMLDDYFPHYYIEHDDDCNMWLYVNIDGKYRRYTIYMTLSPYVNDRQCMRARIKGTYYYFSGDGGELPPE